ncbi:PleD family two-component system response regulator [Allorhizobium sp. BGMRC 0089]|uniref:PleD family two-component system response regulator n=1 Tax=Allorhizobium sonneratiae TaxID=2934936 RepID=UPI0020349EDE|nr:PleD family two-component system response regulator [Allorhizobium sonneratiae]MCM2292194.1 PleD family two-component system response regulator [Allorhizobium sonneratiae]
MTARILVVDDVPANVKLLEARLLAEYFDVLTAYDGYTALDLCARTQVDVILLDIMMPGMDGFDVCERLKSNPRTAHIPIVMVTALDQPSDRVRGLRAGADDFLTKPVNDFQLLARVRSLVRLKTISDELRLHDEAARRIGMETLSGRADTGFEEAAQVLLVDSRASSQERIVKILKPIAEVKTLSDAQAALFEAAEANYDLVVVNAALQDYDPLRLCSQLRSVERTRFIPVLMMAEAGEEQVIARALDLGVNDYIMRPVEPNELLARSMTQIRRKRYHDRLRSTVEHTIEMAVTDSLTGLSNRRYLDRHLEILLQRARTRKRPLSVCLIDIDRFKQVNDLHGHDVGDEVLREFAARIRSAVRGADLACRYGGEEFVVVMPDTQAEVAGKVAERLREIIEQDPFLLSSGKRLPMTASIGIATVTDENSLSQEQLLRQADQALYQAKKEGRNRVVSAAA